jgi:hypothetical protein
MSRSRSLGSRGLRSLAAVGAMALLAGCASNSGAIPAQSSVAAPDVLSGLGPGPSAPDAKALPKCKGQKNTKDYAKVAKELLNLKGGSLCVPAFGGWGGDIQYPEQMGSAKYNVGLITSTKAYKGGNFPPAGSQKPIFYLQLAFNSFPGFYSTIPKGNPLVSSHLVPKKTYTVKLYVYYYALGWEQIGSGCYQVAEKSKYGGALPAVGGIFENVTFSEKNGVIEIFPGMSVSTQC